MATDKESQEISRRSFLKRTAFGGAGLVVATDILEPNLLAAEKQKSANATMIGVPFDARERVRLGIIGVGGRGSSLLRDLLAVENVEVKAICDLVPEKVEHAQKAVTSAGQPEPAGFSKGEWDFKNLTQLDLDIVYIATTHPSHRDNAVAALNAGKHVLVEKPLAVDAAGAREIGAAAASANRFAGEAMWTKFLPKFDVIRQLLDDGALGEVRTVIADHGEFFTPDHRIYDPQLAGGPLLDLGTYPIALAHMVFGSFTSVVAQGQHAAKGLTGQISAMLSDASGNQALLHTSILSDTPTAAVIGGRDATLSRS